LRERIRCNVLALEQPRKPSNFADSFTSDSDVVMHEVTMAYLARRAIQGAGTVLRFEVLKGTAAPAELVAEPVSTSVRAYAGEAR